MRDATNIYLILYLKKYLTLTTYITTIIHTQHTKLIFMNLPSRNNKIQTSKLEITEIHDFSYKLPLPL